MIQRPTDIVTLRQTSLIEPDLNRHADALDGILSGKSVLVIGGAGSIGSETTALLSQYNLSNLVIVDQDENGLARLMRRLRGSAFEPRANNIRTLPLCYGSPLFYGASETMDAFDFVLNFAALKHVRSEKEIWSTLQMMRTNILWQSDLLNFLAKKNSPDARFFSVSTDKAANPVSFMGATKRLMEHVIFNKNTNAGLNGGVTSARFANVAYSQGSLLESFVQRLEMKTPLAAPTGIKRFFVSLEEAGELCLLAAILGEAGSIYIPSLDPGEYLVDMQTAAARFLQANGYEAVSFPLAEQTKAFEAFPALHSAGKWPLILTPPDTAGEKPYEEFVGRSETAVGTTFGALKRIEFSSDIPTGDLDRLLDRLRDVSPDALAGLTAERMMQWVADIEPAFRQTHISSDVSLDDRI